MHCGLLYLTRHTAFLFFCDAKSRHNYERRTKLLKQTKKKGHKSSFYILNKRFMNSPFSILQ